MTKKNGPKSGVSHSLQCNFSLPFSLTWSTSNIINRHWFLFAKVHAPHTHAVSLHSGAQQLILNLYSYYFHAAMQSSIFELDLVVLRPLLLYSLLKLQYIDNNHTSPWTNQKPNHVRGSPSETWFEIRTLRHLSFPHSKSKQTLKLLWISDVNRYRIISPSGGNYFKLILLSLFHPAADCTWRSIQRPQ